MFFLWLLLQVFGQNAKTGLALGKKCYSAGKTAAARDAACSGDTICERWGRGKGRRKWRGCFLKSCCTKKPAARQMTNIGLRKRCWHAGKTAAARDAACKGDTVCERFGWGKGRRKWKGCILRHCCIKKPVAKAKPMMTNIGLGHRCYHAGKTAAERDAACKGDTICTRKMWGKKARKWKGCWTRHCCTKKPKAWKMTNIGLRKKCYYAGKNAAARDAACAGDTVCTRVGWGKGKRKWRGCLLSHCCTKVPGTSKPTITPPTTKTTKAPPAPKTPAPKTPAPGTPAPKKAE